MASSQPQGCHKIVQILREIFAGASDPKMDGRGALIAQKRSQFCGFCVLRGQ
jgi:hypothetical protein